MTPDITRETDFHWLKFGTSFFPSSLGKDVLMLQCGNYIVFIETSRLDKREYIYNANCEVRGDGIQCLAGHKVIPCFALAELCRNPRVLIITYPSFEVIRVFEAFLDSKYSFLRFGHLEYLVALTGLPDFKIIIWNWRSGELLCTQETKFTDPDQVLSVTNVMPLQIAQCSKATGQIRFWEMNICYKRTILNKTSSKLPDTAKPPFAFCFASDGEFCSVDSLGDLYCISAETGACVLQQHWTGKSGPGGIPCIVHFKGGFVFSGPDEVQFWKRKSPEGWTKIWSFTPRLKYKKIISSHLKELLVGINTNNELEIIKTENQIETVTIKSYGADFDFIRFVRPVCDYFVSYGKTFRIISVWSKLNGNLVSFMNWKAQTLVKAMETNPRFPYLAFATSAGSVHLINFYDAFHPEELDDMTLTGNSLDMIKFDSEGKTFCVANANFGEFFLMEYFGNLEVLAYVKTDLKIVDYLLLKSEGNIKLLALPMSQFCCRSGQTLLLYSSDEKNKSFEYIKDIALPYVTTSILRSPSSSKEIFCVVHRSRRICLINYHLGEVVREYSSCHQMKSISMKSQGPYLITYGADGLVLFKHVEQNSFATLFAVHHRLKKGVKDLIVDGITHYVITMGQDGLLVCISLRGTANLKLKSHLDDLFASTECQQVLKPTAFEKFQKLKDKESKHSQPLSEEFSGVSSEGKSYNLQDAPMWLELRDRENVEREEATHRKEKQSIAEELANLRRKVKALLDENVANDEEKQLPIQAFDLDKATRRKKLEDAKTEREKEKQIQMTKIKNLMRITDVIKKTCWDPIVEKGREIHGITSPISVQSYALMPESKASKTKLTWLVERMKIQRFFQKGCMFEPWIPRTDSMLDVHLAEKFQFSSPDVTQTIKTKFEDEQLEDEKSKMENEERKARYVWTGTSSHNFVDVEPGHYSQFELTTFLQCHEEIQLIEIDIKKLMLWFNKEFSETFALKEREMAGLYDRNNRLRHIISELNYFQFSPEICKTDIYDPQWVPQENPETIIKVEDSEIAVPMYVTDSQMEMMAAKQKEEERLRLLMLEDNFRERALLVMMDGVLEKLWEDEIKKDPPAPRCLDKEMDTWTEDDMRAMKAYEEALKYLANERERYRKILETEWSKATAAVKDSVSKFDEKLTKLHLLKLKVESAIGQEILKILRIRERCFKRIQLDRKEESLKIQLTKNEKKIDYMGVELNKLTEMLNECKAQHETYLAKDRNLEKNFKKEFPEYSPIVQEQLYKLSKKRPKLTQKASAYPTILNDIGRGVVSTTKPEHVTAECIQYLKDVDAMDAHVNAPVSVSQQSWDLACKLRRIKIECELKIRSCAIELADAELTVANYQKALKAAKEHHTQLQNDLNGVRAEKLNSALNYQIQLVLKKGLVEIPLTGQISDFCEANLVTVATLNEVNNTISSTGLQKITAMQKAANFRKGIIYKEWEHKKMRMEIEDLKNKLETVEKIQVVKELQAILVARARGFSDEKGFLYLENELATVKEKIQKAEIDYKKKMDEIEAKIERIHTENKELDGKIVELNVEVNEMNLGRDKDFDKKNLAANMRRMRKVRERSRLVRIIQEQHNEIIVLQTQLELLRLRNYPTIKYKMH